MSDAPVRTGPLAAYAGTAPPQPEWFANAVASQAVSRHVTVARCPIHYLQWGKRGNPGLLLVHGNGAHAFWWSFIAPFFSEYFNVVAMDLSGMGDSGRREIYTMDHFVDEQIVVAEDAGLFEADRPPVIVAHSFGGFVTILTGALHGQRLGGVVIVDSPVSPPERRDDGPPKRELRPHRIYPDLASALARFRLAPDQPCENHFIVDFIARKSLIKVDGGWTWKFDPSIWTRFSIGDMAERLRSTRCRIALMRGELSDLMPHEVGEYMFNLLGRAAPVVEIPQARHHVMLDQPIAFISALRALLADWEHSSPTRKVIGPGPR
jgi:pimeloyl-ACP methyl ester carboxylesterase